MITVSTYLRTPDGTFEPVESSTSAPADPAYIEGAVELTVDGTTVIGTAEWDYVDQLWAYLADMLRAAGLSDVEVFNLAAGVVAIHRGYRFCPRRSDRLYHSARL